MSHLSLKYKMHYFYAVVALLMHVFKSHVSIPKTQKLPKEAVAIPNYSNSNIPHKLWLNEHPREP